MTLDAVLPAPCSDQFPSPRSGRPRESKGAYCDGVWIVELVFTDSPERLAARPAHRQRLNALHESGHVRLAGPIGDDSGAVIVFDTPDRDTLDRHLADDPYFSTPGVTIHQIREWQPFIS